MKISALGTITATGLGLSATVVSAFQAAAPAPHQRRLVAPLGVGFGAQTASGADIDISQSAQRDVYPTLQEWAVNCGVQTCPGFELTTQDGQDWSVITSQNIEAGSPVLYVPAEMVISSTQAEQEFGGNLEAAENTLIQYEGTAQRLPLFRLMVKILSEYENGYQSPYFPWLNSLPRQFYNGVAMTGKFQNFAKKARETEKTGGSCVFSSLFLGLLLILKLT
jgi:hypothetical protein